MAIPDRVRHASTDPRYRLLVTDDASLTLENVATGETFHSGCGAVSECRHVYMENSGVGERLAHGRATSVLEIGFGTGMAFLVTAGAAARGGAALLYTAIEIDPLRSDCLRQVLMFQPPLECELGHLRDRLVAELERAEERMSAQTESAAEWRLTLSTRIHLRLVRASAVQWRGGDHRFDAIYFDPFSPASAPLLWSETVLREMHECLRPDGRLVSYCVNSQVRRRLERIGFVVRRAPGPPGGKREVLVATKTPDRSIGPDG